jgi:2-keto-3-deoxy-L-rhamnonate aldolase RhmA
MNPAAELTTKINSDRITTGVLVTDQLWLRLIEICKLAGLDYAIIDCEHGPHDDTTIAQACAVGRMLNFPVLIRPISYAYDQVRRAIDLGPCGLMIPSVENVEQLDIVRDAVLLPPRGRRIVLNVGREAGATIGWPTVSTIPGKPSSSNTW